MRLVIIGNGPSLDDHLDRGDFDLLLDEEIPSIAVNMIDKIYHRTVWRPTHWIWVENHWRLGDKMWMTAVKHHLIPQVEICHVSREYYVELRRWIHAHGNGVYPYPEPDAGDTDLIKWIDRCPPSDGHCGQIGLEDSVHPYQGIPQEWHYPIPCRFGGSINTALTTALKIAEGESLDLAVIGCDLGLIESPPMKKDPNHFGDGNYPTYLDGRLKFERQDDTLRYIHQMAKDYYLKHDGSIINAGIGGELEVHPRMDLKEWISNGN